MKKYMLVLVLLLTSQFAKAGFICAGTNLKGSNGKIYFTFSHHDHCEEFRATYTKGNFYCTGTDIGPGGAEMYNIFQLKPIYTFGALAHCVAYLHTQIRNTYR